MVTTLKFMHTKQFMESFYWHYFLEGSQIYTSLGYHIYFLCEQSGAVSHLVDRKVGMGL